MTDASCPFGRKLHGWLLMPLFVVALTGCRDADNSAATTVKIPEIMVDSPEWSGIGDDEIVATMGDIRIPAWRVRNALAKAPAGANPDDVLYSVMAEELLARQAAGGKGFKPDRGLFEKTLASRFIQKKVIDEFTPENVPMDMLTETFAIPQVWARFNHFDLYEVQDYQWICCADPTNCDPAVSDYCFKEGEAPMAAVRQALDRDNPDPTDLAILAPEYRKVAYHLTYQEYTFAFDKTAGYQKGLSHIDGALADEIMKISEGQYTAPVKSKFGWHIARLVSHKPEEHRDLSDPEVRKEIATFFIQRFRQNEFLKILAGLVGTDSLKLLQMYYEKRPAPGVTPRYDVRVFRDALREATFIESEKEGAAVPQI